MPSIGFGEIALILLIIIIFVKPEDIPSIATKMGRAYSKALSWVDEFRRFALESEEKKNNDENTKK